MNAPARIETAEEALARFQAQWPVERTRAMWAACCGTPAERDAATARILAQAMERNSADTPADASVRSLVGGMGE